MNLGLISIGAEEESSVETLSAAYGHTYTSVQTKTQFGREGILIVHVGEGDHFLETCEWLLAIQESSHALVWLILSEVNKKEIDIYLQLGINGWV